MKLVPENIDEALDFERGQDPKKAMDIGQTMLDRKFIEETPWTVSIMDSMEIVELHKNFYKGYPALIMIDHGAIMKTSPRYFANSILGINSKYRGSPKLALENFKDIIKWKIIKKNTFESQEFTREGDPLKKMSVGQTAIDQHIIDTTLWALRKEMWEDTQGRPYEPNELIRDYKGFPILLLKDPNIDPEEKSNMSAIWIATSTMSYTNWTSSRDYATHRMKTIIDELLLDSSVQKEINKFKIKHGEPIEEDQHFTREGDPLPKMGIGRNRFPSKMGAGYTSLYNDGEWSIEKYRNPNTDQMNLVVVCDESKNGDESPVTDWPIMYDDGSLAFDNPYVIPEDIKAMVRALYPKIRKTNESQNFTRKGTPMEKMGIGREIRLKQLNAEIGWDWDVKKYPDFTEEQVMDIFPYKKSPHDANQYFIKVSRLWFIVSPDEIQRKYMITSNVGEDYPLSGPELHKSESDIPSMIAGEKKWIDEYLESM